MEFPKVGDKYTSNTSGVEVTVSANNQSIGLVQLCRKSDGYKYNVYLPTLREAYSKIPLEIELGSRWLLSNGRLITVSGKDHGMIKYYFGEAYCFTKVRFSKYESNFLSECSPFTGDLDDYNTSGDRVVPSAATGTVEITSSDDSVSLEKVGDYIYAAPNITCPDVVCDISFDNYVTSEECERIVKKVLSKTFLKACGSSNSEKPVNSRNPPENKPLWKRILRKLV